MDLLKNLSKAKIAAIIGSSVATLVVLGMLIFSMSKPTMVPLYGELSQEDASLVVSKLQAMGKNYTTDKNGKTILVPISDVLPIRMQLAEEGIPNDSKILGYEVFDKNDIIGSSQFVNNVNELRALEGELVRTINSLSEIDQSRVHLVLPKSDYFSKSGNESSASVFVKVKHGKKLNESQVSGIANLVASAVPGLSVEKVAIVDQNGKALKTPGEDDQAGNSKSITEYKSNLENKLKKSVEEIVEKYVGVGKVQANVVAEIDFDKIVINQEDYNPDRQVIRSQRNSNEVSNDTEMDKNVSAGTNIPNFLQKPEPSSLKEHKRNDEIINYEISKTVTNKVLQWGAVKQLSVAVLVDGVYDKDKNTRKEVYLRDRTPEELSKIKQLVSAAIGIDESRGDKIEVMNLPFASNDMFADAVDPGAQKYDAATLAQLMIVLVVIILAAVMFFKPNLKKIFNKNTTVTNEIPQSLQEKLSAEEFKNSEAKSSQPFAEKQYEQLLKYLNDSASENVDDTIKIIRNWITQNK
jgi:flagellar M-ring protein FliF